MSTIRLVKHYAIHWQTWLHGLIGATVGGGANAIAVCVVKPDDFNLGDGLSSLLKVFAISAIISAALYLKSSPVPPMETVEDKEVTP